MSDYDMPANEDSAEPETRCKHTSAYCIGEGWNTNADNTVTMIRHYCCEACDFHWVETQLYLGDGRNAPNK